MTLTETVNVFVPSSTVLADLNVVPNAYMAGKKGLACNIHRGTQQAIAEASVLGLIDVTSGIAYFAVDAFGSIGDRYVLVDGNNDAWVIRGRPVRRNRFAATAHCRALVTQLMVRPDGVPA